MFSNFAYIYIYIILRVGLDIKTWRRGFPRGRKAVQALCHVFDLMESMDEQPLNMKANSAHLKA